MTQVVEAEIFDSCFALRQVETPLHVDQTSFRSWLGKTCSLVCGSPSNIVAMDHPSRILPLPALVRRGLKGSSHKRLLVADEDGPCPLTPSPLFRCPAIMSRVPGALWDIHKVRAPNAEPHLPWPGATTLCPPHLVRQGPESHSG